MKLKKREITLNEADSLKDVFYWEKMLVNEYEAGGAVAFRKETINELKTLKNNAVEDMESVRKLCKQG